MPKKRIKALFLDIDEVFTTTGRPEERKVVAEAVEKLVNAKEAGYTRFEFITGRSGHWVLREFVPHLEKFGLLPNSEIFCENGQYKIVNKKFVFTPDAKEFMQFRKTIADAIGKEIKAKKIPATNATEKADKVVQVRFTWNSPAYAKALQAVCEEVIGKLKKDGKIPKSTHPQITKHGTNIFPGNVNKGSTARAIERRIFEQTGRKVRGHAFGDQAVDIKMARGKQVKWHSVSGVEQFKKLMDNLTFRRQMRRRL